MPFLLTDQTLVYRADITTPINQATALIGYWWLFHPQHGAIFRQNGSNRNHVSPQCDENRMAIEILRCKSFPWAEIRFVRVAYVHIDSSGNYILL